MPTDGPRAWLAYSAPKHLTLLPHFNQCPFISRVSRVRVQCASAFTFISIKMRGRYCCRLCGWSPVPTRKSSHTAHFGCFRWASNSGRLVKCEQLIVVLQVIARRGVALLTGGGRLTGQRSSEYENTRFNCPCPAVRSLTVLYQSRFRVCMNTPLVYIVSGQLWKRVKDLEIFKQP